MHPVRLLAYGLTSPPPSLPEGNGVWGLVADYSGATAPEFHGLPFVSSHYLFRKNKSIKATVDNAKTQVNRDMVVALDSKGLQTQDE